MENNCQQERHVKVNISELKTMKYQSMKRSNVWAAFLNLKGILNNLSSPNGLAIAVLGTSSG